MVEDVDLRIRVGLRLGEPNAAFDRFVLDEGLELLAAYRSITDSSVRGAVRDLVRKIATPLQPVAKAPQMASNTSS